jgi:hypothetical protein
MPSERWSKRPRGRRRTMLRTAALRDLNAGPATRRMCICDLSRLVAIPAQVTWSPGSGKVVVVNVSWGLEPDG